MIGNMIAKCRLAPKGGKVVKYIIIAMFFALIHSSAWANSCPNYTYTFTNGTTADANQVMSNFNTIMNCASFFVGGTTAGTATAQTLSSVSPGVFTLTSGNRVTFIAGFNTTGATTLNIAATGVTSVLKRTSSGLIALAANDMVSGQVYTVQYDGTQYELLDPLTTTTSGSAGPVVGVMRNLIGSGAGGVKTASWTVDELIAETTLGGTTYKGANLNFSFVGSTTGAGGMDIGTTPTGGALYIYAIYNPEVGWNTLGTTAGSGAAIYPGSNMPTGYIASALIWSDVTDSSGNIQKFQQQGRNVFFPKINALNITSAVPTTYTAVSISGIVPPNAKTIAGIFGAPAGGTSLAIASDSAGSGEQIINISMLGSGFEGYSNAAPYSRLALTTAQTFYYKAVVSTAQCRVDISGFTF